ncbi:hypothetical protein [Streptomyces mirabilis]
MTPTVTFEVVSERDHRRVPIPGVLHRSFGKAFTGFEATHRIIE